MIGALVNPITEFQTMHEAPTSAADSTAAGDIGANATSFVRDLRAADTSPMTIKSYVEAVRQFVAR